MKGSGLLERQAQMRQELLSTAERILKQLMLDTLQVTLHNEFGWGYERIVRLTDAWGEVFNHYRGSCSGGVEADVLQEHLDRCLRDIVKDHMELIPFEERYPDIRKITYDKRGGKR